MILKPVFVAVLVLVVATAGSLGSSPRPAAAAACGGAIGPRDGGSADAGLADPPQASLSPASGLVGATVTVKGSGYRPSADMKVTFRTGGDPVVATAKADATGAISMSFVVPFALSGAYEVLISDSSVFCYNTILRFVVVVGSTTPTPVPPVVPTVPANTPVPTSTPRPAVIPATPAPPRTGTADAANSAPGFDLGTTGAVATLAGMLVIAAALGRRWVRAGRSGRGQ